MRKVIHQYGVELDWMADMAIQLGGHVDGRYIVVPGEARTGTRYVCSVNEQITAFIVDVAYNEDVIYKLRNTRDDFVGIYFNLTQGDAIHVLDGVSRSAGSWGYNLAVFDAKLGGEYLVRSGSTTFMVAIFMKKHTLKEYVSDIPSYRQVIDSVFDARLNTIVRFDRMSNKAWWLLEELRKVKVSGSLYDVFVQATVYGLISDYLDQLINEEIILETVVEEDIARIIESQTFLLGQHKGTFPGIRHLASDACMSDTKYKKLFKKITGQSANTFFSKNKLAFAREQLETGNYTVQEIAEEYSFFDASHLIEQFKKEYGLTPKEYLTLL